MKLNRLATLAAAGLLAVVPTIASAQTWTDWTSSGPNLFSGTLLGVGVSYLGPYAAGSELSNNPADFFCCSTDPYTQNGLTSPDAGGNHGFVQIINATVATIKFTASMTDIYLAFISVGRTDTPVTYTFDHPFTVLSNDNCPMVVHWSCGSYTLGAGNSITGREFSGTIQFSGSFTELNLSTNPDEDWHGITVGAKEVSTATPEPATLGLFATGIIGLAGAARVRRKRAA